MLKFIYSMILLFFTILVSCNKVESPTTTPTSAESVKIQAASTTATTNSFCTAVQPFYWEIGSASGMIGGATSGGATPDRTTALGIASASKFIFASYVIEKKNAVLVAADIKALNFTSGYSTFTSCSGYLTVGSCYSGVTGYVAGNDNKFYYGGGHFQKYASVDLSLSALSSAALATEVSSYIGADVGLSYSIPQPAGGAVLSAAGYATFLKKVMNNLLRINSFLGSNALCTNTTSCASSSVSTPIPSPEAWSYSMGHWIENDPSVGDGAFSSPGLYGFYPWISADKTRYGILARYDTTAGAYWNSVLCGRLIRKAYTTGTAQ